MNVYNTIPQSSHVPPHRENAPEPNCSKLLLYTFREICFKSEMRGSCAIKNKCCSKKYCSRNDSPYRNDI